MMYPIPGYEGMWKVIYYETSANVCSVADFIDSRSRKNQAKIFAVLDLLEDKGPNLPRPYADLLEDGIHELRIKLSGDQVRILYFFCFKDFIVLTNSFTKHEKRVPGVHIEEAKRCRTDFLSRVSKETLGEAKHANFQSPPERKA
jgi:hypothetical protein